MPESAIINTMQGPLCGTLATMVLYGVICTQVFQYAYNHATSDRHFIKWLVACIWILESVHTAFSIHFIEYYLILRFDDATALNHVVWTMGATYIFGFVVAWVVDLFFAWRFWKWSKNTLMCTFLVILSTIRIGAGIANVSIGLTYPAVQEFLVKLHPFSVAVGALSAFSEKVNAVMLFRKQRSGMKGTDQAVKALLVYTIHTGALTALFAFFVLITFLALGTMDFSAFVQVQSKLYAISMLASLNARKKTVKDARAAAAIANDESESLPLVHPSEGKLDQFESMPDTEAQKDVEKQNIPSPLGSSSYP